MAARSYADTGSTCATCAKLRTPRTALGDARLFSAEFASLLHHSSLPYVVHTGGYIMYCAAHIPPDSRPVVHNAHVARVYTCTRASEPADGHIARRLGASEPRLRVTRCVVTTNNRRAFAAHIALLHRNTGAARNDLTASGTTYGKFMLS